MWRLAAGGAKFDERVGLHPTRAPRTGPSWRRATSIESITLSESEGQGGRAPNRRSGRPSVRLCCRRCCAAGADLFEAASGELCRKRRWLPWRRCLLQGATRPVGVAEVLVLVQHDHQVPLIPHQVSVQQCSSPRCRSARAPAGSASHVLTATGQCGGPDLLLSVRGDRTDHGGRRTLCPRQARPGCSTRAFAAPDRRVIESQSVRLSANFLRPERRSTDGQVILKAISD